MAYSSKAAMRTSLELSGRVWMLPLVSATTTPDSLRRNSARDAVMVCSSIFSTEIWRTNRLTAMSGNSQRSR